MNIVPLSPGVGMAGSPLAQTKGAAVERATDELDADLRQVYHLRKAQAAAEVGQPDGEDHQTAQRDADGRRPWEDRPEGEPNATAEALQPSKDPTRQLGNFLDAMG